MTNQDSELLDVLCVYHTTYKIIAKFTPFQLVYREEAILPIELELPSLQIVIGFLYELQFFCEAIRNNC